MKKIFCLLVAITTLCMCGCEPRSSAEPPGSAPPVPQSASLSMTQSSPPPESLPDSSDSPPEYPPVFGIDKADPSSVSSPESSNTDFNEKYPDGRFIIRVVDSQNAPLVNARVLANLDYPEYQEEYRGTVTNADGEGSIEVPQDSTREFISGEYEFKVIQYLPDGSTREKVIKETLTADNTYPVFNLTPLPWATDTELFKSYEDKVVAELLKDGKPVKNTWSTLSKAGESHPDSGGAAKSLGRSEGFTDAEGKIYFYNVPAGSYVVAFHTGNMYRLGYLEIEVEGGKTQEISLDIGK